MDHVPNPWSSYRTLSCSIHGTYLSAMILSKSLLCVFLSVDSDFIQGVKKVFGSDDKKELVDPYFVFSFAGKEVRLRRKQISTLFHMTNL